MSSILNLDRYLG
uniref:Uncharacterized protein n=1 Tax=Arundo donax TaxID=35708 RepID=A0A0A8YQ78_ARUDO